MIRAPMIQDDIRGYHGRAALSRSLRMSSRAKKSSPFHRPFTAVGKPTSKRESHAASITQLKFVKQPAALRPDQDVQKVQESVTALWNQLQFASNERDQVRQRAEELFVRNELLEKHSKAQHLKLMNLETEFAKLQASTHVLKDKYKTRTRHNEDQKSAVRSLGANLATCETELEFAKECYVKCNSQLQVLRKQSAEWEEQHKSMKSDLVVLREKQNALQNDLSSEKSKRETVEGELKYLNEHVLDAKNALIREYEIKSVQWELMEENHARVMAEAHLAQSNLKTELDLAIEHRDRLHDVNKDLTADLDQVRAHMEEHKRSAEEKTAQAEVDRAETERVTLIMVELQAHNDRLQDGRRKYVEEKGKLREDIRLLHADVARMKEELINVNAAKAHSVHQYDISQAKSARLEKEIETLRESAHAAKQHSDSKVVEKLKEEIGDYKVRVAHLDKTIQKLKMEKQLHQISNPNLSSSSESESTRKASRKSSARSRRESLASKQLENDEAQSDEATSESDEEWSSESDEESGSESSYDSNEESSEDDDYSTASESSESTN